MKMQAVNTSKIIAVIGSIVAGPILLTGCGGGGGGSASGFEIPFTCSNTASSIAGCWASELCATNAGVPGVRLIEVVEQTGTTPNLNGTVRSFLLEYENTSCSGGPVAAQDLNDLGGFSQTYEEQGFDTCSESVGLDPISCVQLDMTVTAGALSSTGFTSYAINDADDRLCLSPGDYNFDNTGNGGMGLPLEDDEINRPNIIDVSTDNCMTRITF